MDSSFNLKNIITNFQANYCPWVKGKKSGFDYPQVPINRRKELLTILVLQIKEHGKPKDFFTNSRRDEIVKEITPPKESGLPKSTLDGFKNCTRKSLDWVIELCYNEKSVIESSTIESLKEENINKNVIKLFDPNRFKDRADKEPPVEDILDEEMAKLLGLDEENE